MAVAPPLPTSLDSKDMKWVRWITERAEAHERTLGTVQTNTAAAAQQAASAHTAVSTVVEKTAAQEAVNPSLPVGPPQVPTKPTLYTDHGTVTLQWDGLVHANLSYTPQAGDDKGSLVEPYRGFNHVSAWRATSQAGPYTLIGGSMGHEGSLVDANVDVGSTYWYYLVTTDNAGAQSDPSEAASVLVVGVDLGSLNTDVTAAIQAAADAGAAGLAAAQAGQAAVQAATDASNTASAQAAAALLAAQNAQTAADNALDAAENATGTTSVYIGSTQPTDTTGQVLWIDTTNGGNKPKRYVSGSWVVITDKAATDAAAAAVAAQTAAQNAQTTANNAVTAAATADGKATTAQTTADGKNTVTYATTTPSNTTNPGKTKGDIWWQQDATGKITAQFVWSGTAWVNQQITNAVIANIDAGKITTGYLAAARINAGTITASQMVTGTITAASAILADAVITTAKIADLAVGTAKIADLAVSNAKIADLDANKIQAGTIVAGKLAAGSVTTNNIVAGAIDTNRLAAGAITANKLSLGVAAQATSSTNRVPAPLTDNVWWSNAIANYVPSADGTVGNWTHPNENVSSQTWGLVFSSTASARAIMGIMPMFLVPPSRKINIRWVASGNVTVQVRQMAGTATNWTTASSGANGSVSVTLGDGITHYGVYVSVNAGGGTVALGEMQVFEVIGGGGGGQAAQLSPAGLQLFDANGQLAVDLTTNASQYLAIVDNTGSEPNTVAAIDQFGNGAFNEVSADMGFDIQGTDLTDMTNPISLINSAPNGSTWDPDTPLLDRLARGVVYDVTWNSLDEYVVAVNKNSLRIAQDSFILEDGRQYMIVLQSGGLQCKNPTNNVYFELQVSTTPIADINTGTNISRGVIYDNHPGAFVTQTPVFAATSKLGSIPSKPGLANRKLPAGIPIYWQLDLSQGGTVDTAWTLNEFGYARGLTVIDLGATDIGRPNDGNDDLPNVSNFVQMAANGTAPAGSGSTGTSGTSKTVTFYAKDSKTWNQGGSNVVTGSGQYTNGNAMYYGHGASDMGSWMGQFRDGSGRSLNSVVGGKTVTSATLTVKNTYTYGSGGASVQFGTSSSDTAPGSIGAPASNVFSASFAKGATKSITLSSGIRSDLSSGAAKSFVLGVSSSVSNYSYFNGASQGTPPKLVVTYH